MMKSAKKKNVTFGVIGAAAIGVTIYMLLSTEKGSETKKKIADTFTDLACKIGDYFSAAKDNFITAKDKVEAAA